MVLYHSISILYSHHTVAEARDWPSAAGVAVASIALRYIGADLGGVAATTVRTEDLNVDRKSTRLNSSHIPLSRMPSSA